MERPRVDLLHPLLHPRIEDIFARVALVHPVFHHGTRRVPLVAVRQIVGEIGGTLVAVLFHPLDELWIHRLPTEQTRRLLRNAAQDNTLPVARITRIGARCLARQRPHSRNHTAVVGVVVIRAEHVRLTRILIFYRDIQPRHAALKDLRIIRTCHSVAAVCRSREPRIDRGEIVESLPCL